jgi:hypothetical protein
MNLEIVKGMDQQEIHKCNLKLINKIISLIQKLNFNISILIITILMLILMVIIIIVLIIMVIHMNYIIEGNKIIMINNKI